MPYELDAHSLRSALTLKVLTFERTGAIVAVATTLLPEAMGGERNWDYRFSWVRDSVFAVRALHLLGFIREADRFQQFIKRRLTEIELDWLDGYRQSRPVRIGNKAAKQMQLDIYGELFEMAWQSHASDNVEAEHYWSFLADVANTVCNIWQRTDHGIWEMRSAPQHYVLDGPEPRHPTTTARGLCRLPRPTHAANGRCHLRGTGIRRLAQALQVTGQPARQ